MSHSKSSTTTFQPSYLLEFSWVKEHPTLKTAAICSWCHKVVNISGMGKTALRSHAKSTKHILNEKSKQTSLPLKMFFKGNTDTSVPGPSTSKVPIEGEIKTAKISESEPILGRPVSPTIPKTAMKQYLLSESITKCEIMWCLQAVMNHIPFAAAARCAKSFKDMFPDSDIATKLKLDYTKLGYVIVFGLAPYFERQLEQKLKECSCLTLCFDESLNKVSQRQQMDLHFRFWDHTTNKIQTMYLSSVFLGHSKATDLLEAIKKTISPETLTKVIQISMDGPNVNIKLLNDMQKELAVSPESPVFLNIGSCGLHTLHGAFKTGMIATKWDLVGFLRALYNLFKDSPARRADYTHYSRSDTFPLKFCAVRWVESGRVVQRAILILPSVKKYVDAMVKDKKEPECSSFKVVKEKLNDKLLPAKLGFFTTMCGIFEPFLREFQCDAPMAPFVYNEIGSVLSTLIEKVVNKDHLQAIRFQAANVDFSPSNLIPVKNLDLGFATKDALKNCTGTSDLEKLTFKKDARDAIIATSKKIIEKSPMKYPLSKYITCLDPGTIKNNASERQLTKCLEELVNKKWMTGITADNVKRQYIKLFSMPHILEQCKNYRRKETRLDDFLIQLINEEGPEEFEQLQSFIILILTLSHGNASVERGFSVNKECIVENLKEESLVALRRVCEGVRVAGGVQCVQITKDLIHSAKNAHARYTEYLAKRREEMREKGKVESERKQALKEKKQLEEERLRVLSDARKRASEIDEKIVKISKKC